MKRAIAAALLLMTAVSVHAQVATTGAGPQTIAGHTEPVSKVEIPSGMKGQIDQIFVKEGQAVKKDTPLAKLDDKIQQATVQLAKQKAETTVEIRGAENQIKFAQSDLDLTKEHSGSPGEIRQKELTLEQSKLSLEIQQEHQREAQLELQREQITLDHMTIRSPIDGSVLRVNKQVGEETDENPLMIVVQTSKLNAVFFPPAALFGKVHVGDKFPLDFDGFKRDAIVVAVDPIIDQASGLFRVKMELDNTDAKIPAGVAATWNWTGK